MRLFLCEKPSQAKDIARVLGAQQRANGCLMGPDLIVTWCIGHLLEAAAPEDYDERYKRWSIAELPIIPERWKVRVKAATASQFRIVQQLIAQATEVVIATDADREGEMIGREILDLCNFRGPVQRLWLSALNDASIRKSLSALRPGAQTLPLYFAALGRARADWLVGMNLSRLFTLLGREAGFNRVLSVGRVQTPTLQLVVQRDREIANFVPVPHWAIDVTLIAGSTPFLTHWVPDGSATDPAGRCLKQEVARASLERLRSATTASVTSVHTERVREPPPLPFDLGTLQIICSHRLGLSVQQTLDVAQSLYETHKATTYPRSDCAYLPESMLAEVPRVLAALVAADPTLAPIIAQLDPGQRSRAWNDAKVTAHHGIIPTLEPPSLAAFSDRDRAVYELIRAHYLAQFLPHYEFDRTLAQFACVGETLRARGTRDVVLGWRLVLPKRSPKSHEDDDDPLTQSLPALAANDRCKVGDVNFRALKTQAPKPYTQGELVSAMKGIARLVADPRLKQKLKDTTGIGTEATRASIIEALIRRGYLLQQGRVIRASQTAFTLMDAIPAAIADPGTTAIWEQSLDLIAARELTLEEFVHRQSRWVRELIEQYARTRLSIHVPSGPACPECGSPTRPRQGRHGQFWSCARYPQCGGSVAMNSTGNGTRPLAHRTPRRRSVRARSRN